MQIKSDENELDYKFSQNKISKKEYDENVKKLKKKEEEQDLLYDDLIFEIINLNDSRTVKESIIKYNLNNIDLSRLAEAIKSVSENKIEEFSTQIQEVTNLLVSNKVKLDKLQNR